MSISEQALYAVCDRPSLFALLRDQLGWPVDPEDTFTYEGPQLHGPVAARVEVSQIVPFTAGDPYTIMIAEFQTSFRRGDLREILRRIREDIRKRAKYGGRKLDEIIFVCTTEGYGGVRFVRFEERAGRQPRLSAFGWDCRCMEGTRTLRDINLPALKMPSTNILGEPDWAQANWAEAWNVEKVTGEFYRQYRDIFHDLMGQLQGVRGDPRLFTQRLCNRLLFVQFLAKKDWLNRDRNYLRTLYDLAREHAAKPGLPAHKRANFYSDFLHPLFFKALNTPTGDRPADAEWGALAGKLGDVPFLNGGLFARQDADDDPGMVTITNDAFAPMLDLFDRFNFTLTESTPDDVEVAVDAEMLGKVFEELVNEEERHSTGSYYTPRGIVSYMCREAIKGYLGGGDAMAKFIDDDDPSGLRDPEAVLDALKRVTVCDPACGSGAYLLGMMQELLRLRESLFTRKAKDYRRIYDRKLEIIQRNLYGVDKEPFAVNIAMLRLWLSLVVDNDAPVADVVTGVVDVSLPNLKFKIQCGDALTVPMTDFNLFGDAYARDATRLRSLEDEYFAPPHHDRPARPKSEIEADIQTQQERIADLIGSHADQSAVDWCVRFAEVFAASEPTTTIGGSLNVGQGELTEQPEPGGFSICLANPPYVRHELIRDQKPALRAAFPTVYNGTADLYTYFYSRALQLLQPNGMLVFISSNKWFRAGYGANLRRHIANSCQIYSITDFGDLPVFQSATAYPMIFVAQKGRGRSMPVITQVKSLEAPYPDVLAIVREYGRLLPSAAIQGDTWTLSSGATADRLRKMEKEGVPLGEYVKAEVYRGIVTGMNTAFVITEMKRAELIAQDPGCADLIKPFATGKELRRWRVDLKGKWLIFTRRGIDIDAFPGVKAHLLRWKKELEPRPRDWNEDEDGEWPGRKPGNYRWYEIQDDIAYFAEFDKPKIVYPDIALEPRFALDRSGMYLGNTGYFFASDDLYVLGVMNSQAVADYYIEKSAQVRGGYLRFFSQYVERIPIPDAPEAEQQAIAALVQKCLDAKGVECEVWEAEINDRVAALYGL
jgi:hypothetical protein